MLDVKSWTDLERQVIDVSGLEARAEGGVQRVALVLRDRKTKSDDPEVLADTDDLPAVQLLFGVLLQRIEVRNTFPSLYTFYIRCNFYAACCRYTAAGDKHRL